MKGLILLCFALLLSFTIVAFYGCGGDTEETTESQDSGPAADDGKRPTIEYSFPANEQKDIAHDERIVIRFSEAIDKDKFWNGIYFSPVLDLSDWIPSWSRNEVTINPPIGVKPFDLNSEYTLMVPRGCVVDLYGNSMELDHNIAFKTLKYPIEEIKGGVVFSGRPTATWLFSVGKMGSLWTIIWGGTKDPNGPAWSSPGGTITASADGQVDERSIETKVSEVGYPITTSVSKGNGNSLTFTGATAGLEYTLMFDSTSSYLTFDLRSGGTVPKEYVHIGPAFTSPSRTPFILKNK